MSLTDEFDMDGNCLACQYKIIENKPIERMKILEKKRETVSKVIATSSQGFDNCKILKYHGVICSGVLCPSDKLGFLNEVAEARDKVYKLLESQAIHKKANAIIALDYKYVPLGENDDMAIIAQGTAVTINLPDRETER